MTTNTKFQVRYLPQYATEIFGNQEFSEPLLTKNLSQKVKYQLKKLGSAIQEEYKQAVQQLKELYDKYSEEVLDEIPIESPLESVVEKSRPSKTQIKAEFREQFKKEAQEIEDIEVEIPHTVFTEKDFIDHSTGAVVSGNTYFNIVDKLVYEKLELAEKND